jgi:hypothetical protein
MDEQVRVKMHEALSVEKPDGGLRSRVLNSLPATVESTSRFASAPYVWAGGFFAALLAVALIASFLYARGTLSLSPLGGVVPTPSAISAVNGTCRPQDVTLTTIVNNQESSLGVEMTIGISFPNDMLCSSPDVTAQLEDASGRTLVGVEGNPRIANSSHSCSTNVSARCHEETTLYWSNWCGRDAEPYRITAAAFAGQVRASASIRVAPHCMNHQDPSRLGGIG